MQEKDEKNFEASSIYSLYTCPKCLNTSLLRVSSSLYQCLVCSAPKSLPDRRRQEHDFSVLGVLFIAFWLLFLFL